MGHVAGRKYTSSHTTVIGLARTVLGLIEHLEGITKISVGRIVQNRTSRRIRILSDSNGVVRLVVKQGQTLQELYIYCKDTQDTMEGIARILRNNNHGISFR